MCVIRVAFARVSVALICGLMLASPVVNKPQNARPASFEITGQPARQDGRLRPPDYVTCDRNYLTSYTGKVLRYSRRMGRTVVTINTDWDTTESVTLRHPRSSNPARWFRLHGEPFKRDDWAVIELSNKRLAPGMRVTAWVCEKGGNPIIDWQPSTGSETPLPSTP